MSGSPLARLRLRSLRVQLWLWIALPAALGLLGTHERTQAHGGLLQLQSEPGKGTTVEVWLPYQVAPPPETLGETDAA